MKGISTKAAGKLENRFKYNGIEFNGDLDLNAYEAHFRNLDPQIGRWWQIDPKPNDAVSPYAAMDLNPLRNSDFLGDTSILDIRPMMAMSNSQVQEFRNEFAMFLSGKLETRKKAPNRKGLIVQASKETEEQEPVQAFLVNLSYELLSGLNSVDDFITNRINGENSAGDIAEDAGSVVLANISIGVFKTKGGLKPGGIWTPTKKLSPVENAFGHFRSHGSEFPEFFNAKQYVNGTKSFLHNSPAGTLTKTRSNGDILKYHPGTNTFGVMNASGVPKTMFKPIDGMSYWLGQ